VGLARKISLASAMVWWGFGAVSRGLVRFELFIFQQKPALPHMTGVGKTI